MPSDDYGSFNDDVDKIANDAVLFRRITPSFVHWDGLQSAGTPQVPRQGFQDYPEQIARQRFNLPGACMSVAVQYILIDEGYDPEKLIIGYPGYGVAAINAGVMRTLESPTGANWTQGVMWNPTDDEPWHAVVFCQNGGKKTTGMQGAIAGTATWTILPNPPNESATAA